MRCWLRVACMQIRVASGMSAFISLHENSIERFQLNENTNKKKCSSVAVAVHFIHDYFVILYSNWVDVAICLQVSCTILFFYYVFFFSDFWFSFPIPTYTLNFVHLLWPISGFDYIFNFFFSPICPKWMQNGTVYALQTHKHTRTHTDQIMHEEWMAQWIRWKYGRATTK